MMFDIPRVRSHEIHLRQTFECASKAKSAFEAHPGRHQEKGFLEPRSKTLTQHLHPAGRKICSGRVAELDKRLL